MIGPAEDEPTPRALAALIFLAITLVATASYSPAIRGDFVYDDSFLIGSNPAVHSMKLALASFGSSYWSHMKSVVPYYRPLATLSLALDHLAGGLDPAFYHTTNVLLHAACSILVSLLVTGVAAIFPGAPRRAVLAGSAFAGLLAAVHPLHSEAVAAIYCRPDLLAALFGLAFLNLAVRGRSLPALACLALSLFGKESALGLPLLAPFALAAGRRSRWEARRARRAERGEEDPPGATLVPSFGLGVIVYGVAAAAILGGYAAIRYHALGKWMDERALTTLDNPIFKADPPAPWLTPVSVVARYASLWIWPAVLCVERGFDTIPLSITLLQPHFVAGALILLAGAAALVVLMRRRSSWALPLAAAGLAYLPASNLLVTVPVLMGERFVYLPSLFVCSLLGAAYARLVQGLSNAGDGSGGRPLGRAALHTAAAIVLAAGACRTFLRAEVYRDELSLYQDAAESCPRSAKAQYNLGNALSRVHREEEAVTAFRASIAIAPWLAIAHNNLGGSLLNLRRLDESEAAYRKAIDLDPELVKPRASLAMLLFYRGRLQEALDQARIASSLSPAPDDAAYLDELIDRLEKRLKIAAEDSPP